VLAEEADTRPSGSFGQGVVEQGDSKTSSRFPAGSPDGELTRTTAAEDDHHGRGWGRGPGP